METSRPAALYMRRLYVSAFCMDGGFFLLMAAIPFKVLALGGGSVALGLVAAVGSLAYVVFTQVSGRWSDRGGRIWLCLGGNVILIAFAIWAFQIRSLLWLLLAMPLMGLGKALYWPVVQAVVGDLSARGGLERNINLFNVAWSAGKTLGFLAGGLLLVWFDFRTTFLCGAALVAVAFWALPRRRPGSAELEPLAAGETSSAGDGETVSESIREYASERVPESTRVCFRHMAWVANLAAFGALGVLNAHLPKWFQHTGWDEGRFGVFLAVILLVQTFIFYLLAENLRFAYSARRLWAPQIAAGAVLLVLPWLRGFGWLLATAPILGIAFGFTYAASIFYSLHTPTRKGQFAGMHESLIGVGGFLPPLLGGLLVSWSGWLGAPYALAAAGIAAALVWQGRLLRRVRS